MTQPTSPFDPATQAQLDAVIDHLNANHADTVLLVARHLSGEPLYDAELASVDRIAGHFSGMLDGVGRAVRLDFAAPCETVHDIQSHLMQAAAAARAEATAGEPLTSLEAEMAATARLPVRPATVTRRHRLAPNLIEVTLAGLDGYEPLGGDEYHFVLTATDAASLGPDYSIADYTAQGDNGPVRGAYYTARRVRRDAGEVDLWIVLHDHPGSVGDWFSRCVTGDRVALWGPRRSFRPPARAGSLLVVADESGLAAAAALIEERSDRTVTAVVEAVDAAHRPPMPERDGVVIHWVDRGPKPPGTGTGLLDTTRAITAASRFDAAFGAAESKVISAVRRHLRFDLGMAAVDVQMTGYWRRTT